MRMKYACEDSGPVEVENQELMETKVIRENLKAWSIFQRKKVIIEHSKMPRMMKHASLEQSQKMKAKLLKKKTV